MAESALATKTLEAKRVYSTSNIGKKEHSPSISSPADRVQFLQRTIGNKAVQRLLKSGALQAKLKIGTPGDIYEQEADRVAEQVVYSMSPIQRKCSKPCPLEDEGKVQRKVERMSDSAGASVADSFVSNLGPGQPLDKATRAYFEPRFGHDFSQVRVHTDARAAEAAREVNARAFTVGRDVVFGEGEYGAGNKQRLMAHELAHVVQQTSRIKGSISLNNNPLIQRECKHFKAGWKERTGKISDVGGKWCETLEEARELAQACPPDCFVYVDGPESHKYRPIPGYPCAHYVAHELGIKNGGKYETCRQGNSVTIGQIIQGRTAHPLTEAMVNDIYIYPGGGHSGVVRQADKKNGTVKVLVEACPVFATEGKTYKHWVNDGTVYR